MISDKDFLDTELKMGISLENDAFINLHKSVYNKIKNDLKASSILEIGAGVGAFSVSALSDGCNYIGIDNNQLAKYYFISHYPQWKDHYIISSTKDYIIQKPFDVVYSCEVFEHITDNDLHPLLIQFKNNVKWFVFSSTHEHNANGIPDDKWNHINIKQKNEWIEFFKKYNIEYVTNWSTPTPWTMLFKIN